MTNFSNSPHRDPWGAPPPQGFNPPAPQQQFGGHAGAGGQTNWGGQQQPTQGSTPTPETGGPAPGVGQPNLVPAPKNRKPLIITATVTIAVLAVIGVVVAFLMSTGKGGDGFNPSGSPTEVAKAYMEAVARGDAQSALALGAIAPASTELLTNDILKMQLEKLPITEIKVEGEVERKPTADKRTSAVKVSAKFGGTLSEGKLDVVVVDNQWKLTQGYVNVNTEEVAGLANPDTTASLTVFGKPFPKSGRVNVFPGYLEMRVPTPYVAINELPPTTFSDVTALAPMGTKVLPKFSMTDEGLKAVQDVVRAHVDTCLNPGEKPSECEYLLKDWREDHDLNTLRVVDPIDWAAVTYKMSDSKPIVSVSGLLVHVEIARKSGVMSGANVGLAPKVDLGQQPPKIIDER